VPAAAVRTADEITHIQLRLVHAADHRQSTGQRRSLVRWLQAFC
jgi:hypothetical protein